MSPKRRSPGSATNGSVLWVWTLARGPKRFNELRGPGSISQRMLMLTLRGLRAATAGDAHVFPTVPPRVDYD